MRHRPSCDDVYAALVVLGLGVLAILVASQLTGCGPTPYARSIRSIDLPDGTRCYVMPSGGPGVVMSCIPGVQFMEMADHPSVKKTVPKIPLSSFECPKKASLIDGLVAKLTAQEKKVLKKSK